MWLRYADCLSSLGNLEQAVQAFSKVVELAPNHLEARVSLSALQQQIGKHDEAIRVLTTGGHSLLFFSVCVCVRIYMLMHVFLCV